MHINLFNRIVYQLIGLRIQGVLDTDIVGAVVSDRDRQRAVKVNNSAGEGLNK